MEIKNAADEFDSRGDVQERNACGVEGNCRVGAWRQNRMKLTEKTQDVGDSIPTHVESQKERRRKGGSVAENFPKVMEDIRPQMQAALWIPRLIRVTLPRLKARRMSQKE